MPACFGGARKRDALPRIEPRVRLAGDREHDSGSIAEVNIRPAIVAGVPRQTRGILRWFADAPQKYFVVRRIVLVPICRSSVDEPAIVLRELWKIFVAPVTFGVEPC